MICAKDLVGKYCLVVFVRCSIASYLSRIKLFFKSCFSSAIIIIIIILNDAEIRSLYGNVAGIVEIIAQKFMHVISVWCK